MPKGELTQEVWDLMMRDMLMTGSSYEMENARIGICNKCLTWIGEAFIFIGQKTCFKQCPECKVLYLFDREVVKKG